MKCYNCGVELSENDFCTSCGADVYLYKKIIRLSNIFYNEGLEKAKVRDLSGAVDSLRNSLKCNKYNIEARNLLGLVYFERGEAIEAVGEWVLSKHFQPQKNIADDFMNALESNQAKWDNIKQTISKYNRVLEYCQQDSLDMATIQLKSILKINPRFLRAHQLLALLYMKEQDWENALSCIKSAAAIDTNNTMTMTYMREIEEAMRQMDEMDPDAARRRKKKQQRDVIEYTSGNETIIQPINNQEHSIIATTMINIVIGLIIGLAVMWYLILPARMKNSQSEINDELLEVGAQLTEKTEALDEMEKRVNALEEEKVALSDQMQGMTGSDGLMGAYDKLMSAARHYVEGSSDTIEIAQDVMSIDPSVVESDMVSDEFKKLYDTMRNDVCAKASADYLEKGLNALKDDDYDTAVQSLSTAFELDDKNAEALFNLAHAYRRSDRKTEAEDAYRRVITLFPDSEYASESAQYVSDVPAPAQETEPEPSENTEETSQEDIVIEPIVAQDNAEGQEESPAPAGEGGTPDSPLMVID